MWQGEGGSLHGRAMLRDMLSIAGLPRRTQYRRGTYYWIGTHRGDVVEEQALMDKLETQHYARRNISCGKYLLRCGGQPKFRRCRTCGERSPEKRRSVRTDLTTR